MSDVVAVIFSLLYVFIRRAKRWWIRVYVWDWATDVLRIFFRGVDFKNFELQTPLPKQHHKIVTLNFICIFFHWLYIINCNQWSWTWPSVHFDFRSEKNTFVSRNIDIRAREKNLLKALVRSVPLYGGDTRTIRVKLKKKSSCSVRDAEDASEDHWL